jgi:uncharacterized protein YbjT (DUF2867 family)
MPQHPARQLFVAGATGATGRSLMSLALSNGVPVRPHVRPKSLQRPEVAAWANTVSFELDDRAALVDALRGCSTVLQLIGTMKKRFASGDTYETSDVGTTRHLVEAASEAGVLHFVLLSSAGAGRPMGAYLKAKAEAERLVTHSSMAWTIVRPGAFVGEDRLPQIFGHLGGVNPPGAKLLTRLPLMSALRPIHLDQLAAVLLRVALDGAPTSTVLEGQNLWELVEKARGLQTPST